MLVRRFSSVILLSLVAWTSSARAEVSAESDAVLGALVRETLEKSPEYARARAEAAAERERIRAAGALGDTTFTFGIQNDGFSSIMVGEMETSFYQLMVTQPLPWPGKRSRREAAARAQASAAEARLGRIELGLTAEVERAYVELLLVRGQLALLSRLEGLWQNAEESIRLRYDVGAAPQSDLIRARLERTRLRQQRIGFELAKRGAIQALNRLRVHPLDEPIETSMPLAQAELPVRTPVEEALADAERRSPDLVLARRTVEAAERQLESADHERYPDFTISAGVMPRGALEPMWTANVGISLPLFSRKDAAVSGARQRREAELRGEEAVKQVLALRVQERQAALQAALDTVALYREGLLVQSRAAVESTLAQYRVGRAAFASVIDVLRGLVQDESAELQALAEAQRVAIAAREVSLEAPAGTSAAGGVSSGSVPVAASGGGMSAGGGGAAASGTQGGAAAGAAPAGGQSGGSMGGM